MPYTKLEKLNLLIRGAAFILLLSMIFLVVNQLNKVSADAANDLTIIVEKTYQPLIEKELQAFKFELPDDFEISIQVVSEEEALNLFAKNAKTMIVLPRKILPHEQSILNFNRLPLKQDLLATGMVNSPIKELYLIQDDKIFDLEKKFYDFLFSNKGQEIVFQEGYVSARMGFSQH